MARRPRNEAQFRDVIPMLEQCLQRNGAIFEAESEARAVHLLQRCNTWRAHLRNKSEFGMSDYDRFVFTRDKNILLFKPRPIASVIARTLDGEQFDLTEKLPERYPGKNPWTKKLIEESIHLDGRALEEFLKYHNLPDGIKEKPYEEPIRLDIEVAGEDTN